MTQLSIPDSEKLVQIEGNVEAGMTLSPPNIRFLQDVARDASDYFRERAKEALRPTLRTDAEDNLRALKGHIKSGTADVRFFRYMDEVILAAEEAGVDVTDLRKTLRSPKFIASRFVAAISKRLKSPKTSSPSRGTAEYLWTSQALLDPKVGAVEIGLLEAGKFFEINEKMKQEARKKGIENPRMVVDILHTPEGAIFAQGKLGQPYAIRQGEWENFVGDVSKYCGIKSPKVYMVDGDRYTTGI